MTVYEHHLLLLTKKSVHEVWKWAIREGDGPGRNGQLIETVLVWNLSVKFLNGAPYGLGDCMRNNNNYMNSSGNSQILSSVQSKDAIIVYRTPSLAILVLQNR